MLCIVYVNKTFFSFFYYYYAFLLHAGSATLVLYRHRDTISIREHIFMTIAIKQKYRLIDYPHQ